jgi:hypothetical protein
MSGEGHIGIPYVILSTRNSLTLNSLKVNWDWLIKYFKFYPFLSSFIFGFPDNFKGVYTVSHCLIFQIIYLNIYLFIVSESRWY